MRGRGLPGLTTAIAVALGFGIAARPGETATVPASELARCSGITQPEERLACYDALARSLEDNSQAIAPHGGRPSQPSAARAAEGGASSAHDSESSPRAAAASPSHAVAAASSSSHPATTAAPAASDRAASAPSPTEAAPAADADTFGLDPRRKRLDAGPRSIRARVTAVATDRNGNLSVALDNGQTWWLAEAGANLRPGDPVTIKRAALGSFLLVTPEDRSYRSRRVQ